MSALTELLSGPAAGAATTAAAAQAAASLYTKPQEAMFKRMFPKSYYPYAEKILALPHAEREKPLRLMAASLVVIKDVAYPLLDRLAREGNFDCIPLALGLGANPNPTAQEEEEILDFCADRIKVRMYTPIENTLIHYFNPPSKLTKLARWFPFDQTIVKVVEAFLSAQVKLHGKMEAHAIADLFPSNGNTRAIVELLTPSKENIDEFNARVDERIARNLAE
jgi:hypothetical protein